MTCKHCKYWQGNKHTKDYADCQRVIHKLLSGGDKGEDRWGNPPSSPFDPHDLQYFLSNSPIHKSLNKLRKKPPEGVRVDLTYEDVWKLDDHGWETHVRMQIPFIQTHKDYSCGETN